MSKLQVSNRRMSAPKEQARTNVPPPAAMAEAATADPLGSLRLTRKTALIVGSSSGIGEATARLLAMRGSGVCLVARRAERLEAMRQAITATGGRCLAIAMDATDEYAAAVCFERAEAAFGAVDILVVTIGEGLLQSAVHTDSAAVLHLFEINAMTAFRFCRTAYARMAPRGAIILLTSPAGLGGAAGVSAYALTKGGLGPMVRSLAREYARKPIRVNLISPGYVPTEMTERLYRNLSPEQLERAVIKRHPLGPGTPEDIAQAIAFIASDAARWITGATLTVDGGYTAGYEA